MLNEIKKINGKTYIVTDSRYIDPFTITLNFQETFGVFNRLGDIHLISKNLQGVFFEGARHLSQLSIQWAPFNMLLLGSSVHEYNNRVNLHYTNEETFVENKVIPPSILYLKRSKKINTHHLEERFEFTSYHLEDIKLKAQIFVNADFKDVFELRGFEVDFKRNEVSRVQQGEQTTVLSVKGMDDITRKTIIKAQHYDMEKNCIVIDVELPANSSVTYGVDFYFTSSLENEDPCSTTPPQFPFPRITTDNSLFNQWLKRSLLDLKTLLTCYDNEFYPMAGVPWYNTPFGRDGLITSMQTLMFSPQLAKGTLSYLAKNQAHEEDLQSDAAPGKILHEVRKGELANAGHLPFKKYYGAHDSTFLFIWLLGDYVKRTHDIDFLNQLSKNLEQALSWVDKYADADNDGLYEYKKGHEDGLDNQCWKDSWDSLSHSDGSIAKAPLAVIEIQAYAFKAFKAANYLYKLLGKNKQASIYAQKANEIRESVNEKYWLQDKKYFAVAIDHNKKPLEIITSNPAHALITGVFTPKKANYIINRIFQKDLYSGWGIRTLSNLESRFNPMSYHNGSIWPHDNSFILEGLKVYNTTQEFDSLANSIFNLACDVPLRRLPELFCGHDKNLRESMIPYPVSCMPQAWATGVVFQMIKSCLGIQIDGKNKVLTLDHPLLPSFLKELQIDDLKVEGSLSISFKARRSSNNVVIIEDLEKPIGWKFIIER